eukprot:m.12180 g.12180  ORF g.12180 m.12180 type:complete len:358 (+) comp2917_c0_seq1:263-1336(+)
MSRLRMPSDSLGSSYDIQCGNDSQTKTLHSDSVMGILEEPSRPPTPHDAFLATLETPPTSVGPSISPQYGTTSLISSWQTPRHASIHQNAARLRSNSRSYSRSPPVDAGPYAHIKRPSPQSTGVDSPVDGHLFKVLVVGNAGVGKTSLIKRYCHNVFSEQYQSTIGVDFALKVLKVGSASEEGEEEVVRLQLWDIAGQEQFGAMTRVYYKGAVGAFVVFDLSDGSDNGESVRGWKKDIDDKVRMPNGDYIPVVLLANKCDLENKRRWTNKQIDALCEANNFKEWFEVSAKAKVNVTESHSFLVTLMLKMEADKDLDETNSVYSLASADDMDRISLHRQGTLDLTRNPELAIDESCCV